MMLLEELIQMMIGMTDDQLRKIKNFILMKLSIKDPTDTKETAVISCPICKSNHIVKNGKRNGKQQFLCKGCKHSFSISTNTITFKSKHSLETWSNYVSSMIAGMSLRDSADVCHISHKTAFYWRHKVMESLNEVLDGKVTLQDIVEADETFFPVSYKGNHKFSKNFVMPRKPRHRGSEIHKRGISDEQVCVSCMVDNHNNQHAGIAGVGRITTKQLFNLNKVESGAILITDKVSSYQKYAEKFGLDLIQLKAGKEYKRGMYSLAHVNAFHSGLKRFLRPFNGVSTKHLGNYLNWYIWLNQTAKMMFDARSDNMLDSAIQHPFKITDVEIHQKEALPVAA